MRTTIQSNVQTAVRSSLLLLSVLGAPGQGTFQNLGFEDTTLTVILINPGYPYPFYATNATLPGWSWSPHGTFGFGDPNTTVAFNDIALDAAAITLHGTNSFPGAPLSGNYSVLLQGGSQYIPTNYPHGASIYQTGSIPATAQSLIYLGNGALQVSFNGQSLSPVALQTAPTYTTWGIDISEYAGQSGELRFAVPWLNTSLLDGIEFSSLAVPEPSALTLSLIGLLLLARYTRRANQSRQPTPAACLAPFRAPSARRGCALRWERSFKSICRGKT